MSVQIKFTTPFFHLIGDGVATSANLSVFEYPFNGTGTSRPTSVALVDGGDHITSVSLDSTLIVLNFDTAFSGDSGGIVLSLNFQV